MFYEKTPWKEALFGSFDSTFPHELSIVFSDSIVPLAVIFKIIFGSLITDGTVTQYIGLWGFMCYLLQGIGAGLIVKKILNNHILRVSSIIFLCSSPVMLRKLFGHNTLTAHWLILFAFCLFVYQKELEKKRYYLWVALIVLATSIHIYFMPMLIIIMGADLLYDVLVNKHVKAAIITFIVTIISSMVIIWLLGVFTSEISEADPAWGYTVLYRYSCNLNTFINSDGNSFFLPALNWQWGEYEGYGYLGLGGIILITIAVILYIINIFEKKKGKISTDINKNYPIKCRCILGCFLISFIVAVGPKITFFEYTLFTIPVPKWTEYIFATFRSIGRFIWISYYIVILAGFYLIDTFFYCKQKKLIVECLIVGLTLLQIIDLYPAFKKKHKLTMNTVEWQSQIQDEKWIELAEKCEYVYVITANISSAPSDLTNSIMLFVHQNNLKITSTYFAHYSDVLYKESLQYLDEIKRGEAKRGVLYWFENEEYMNQARDYLHCEVIDGYYLGWVE